MPNKFARSNGNFDDPIWALTSDGVAGSTTTPTIGDNAIANTFTIQITGNVACDNITHSNAYGGTAGGFFVANTHTNNVQITARILNNSNGTIFIPTLSAIGTNTLTVSGTVGFTTGGGGYTPAIRSIMQGPIIIYGNVVAPIPLTNGIILATSNSLTIYGTVISQTGGVGSSGGNYALGFNDINISPTITVYGDVIGGDPSFAGSANQGWNCGIFTGNSYDNSNTGTPTIVVYGNVIGRGDSGIYNRTRGSITVVNGNAAAGRAEAILNTSTGAVTVNGNVTASTGAGISNTSTGAVTVNGNVTASTGAGISNTSTGPLLVAGNIIATNSAFGVTSAGTNNRISGNLIGAPNGIPAVYAPSYRVDPVLYQGYIRYANNGTGIGSDAYLYQYTIDSLSAFSMPPVSAVRAGLQYANNALTGTCNVPPASSVTFGTLVDNSTGTALLAINDLSQIFSTSLSSLTVPNTIGSRIRTAATTEATGNLIASFTNG